MDTKPPPREQDIALLVLDPDLVDDEALWRACREDPEARRRTHELCRPRHPLPSPTAPDPPPRPAGGGAPGGPRPGGPGGGGGAPRPRPPALPAGVGARGRSEPGASRP